MSKSPETKSDASPGGRRWWVALLLMLAIGLLVGPWVCVEFDTYNCWFPWLRATGGTRPWRAYDNPECNYPPFQIYVLTVVRLVERVLHIPPRGPAAVLLVKLPNLLAYAAGAVLCATGLRRWTDSRVVALAYVLCLPVWFNAAVWGQCDAVLCLAMLGVIVALINGRPALSAVCLGWALSVKLQAIVIVPVVAIYAFRRFGWKVALMSAAVAVAAVSVLIAPMLIAGRAHAVRLSYTGAVGYFPLLSIDAFNPWSLVKLVEVRIFHIPVSRAQLDSGHWFGPLTPKRLGLAALAVFVAVLSIGLYRRPTRYNLILAAGLSVFGFYMLPTQMHERYVIPAAGLLAMITASGGRRIYLAVMIPALVNQVKGQVSEHFDYLNATTPAMTAAYDLVTAIFAVLNCLVFVWVCRVYFVEVLLKPSPADDKLTL